MAKKPKGNLLESLLRYEIILVLFTLIGVYYFLTFSPVRMPRQAITSPSIKLPPPPSAAKKPKTATKRTTEIKPTPSVPLDNQKNLKISEDKLPEPASGLPELEITKKKNPVEVKKESATPSTVTKKVEAAASTEPIPSATEADSKPTVGQKTAEIARLQPPATKPVKSQQVETPAATATAGQKSVMNKQPTTTRKSTIVAPPAEGKAAVAAPKKKSYVIQAGIFIFPETLKHYQQILKDHGYVSFVTTRKRLLPMHRVFLGPYQNLATARKIIGTINKWGDDPFPCRRGNKFYINVGSFYYQTTAREKINQYRSRGFTPVDFHEPVNVPHHILLVDGFSFNHYPHNALRSIKQLGIPDAFVRNWQP